MQGYIKKFKVWINSINKPIEEIKDILKIAKSLKDSALLLEVVSETIQNEAKEQKGGFISMLLVTLGASLLGNILAGKEIIRAGYDSTGDGTIRVGYGFSIKKYFFDSTQSSN